MAYVMLQYDRPNDVRHWTEYNNRVQDWISRFVQAPGAVSFVAYRTADGSSPNTIAMLEFGTVDEARFALASEPIKAITAELRVLGVLPKTLLVERSPFTPEPIRPPAGRSLP